MPDSAKIDYSLRQARMASAIRSAGLDAFVLNPGPSLKYLTGLNFHLMERPVVVFFIPDAQPVIVLPELEAAKVAHLPYALKVFHYGEDSAEWKRIFQQAALAAAMDGRQRIGVEPRGLRVLELRLLEAAMPAVEFVSSEETPAALRMFKDAAELNAMRKAVSIAQDALLATLPMIKAGMTEREVANELTLQLLRAGSDPEMPFSPIVSGGPNSANPHASPTDRALQTGDLLVIDWGASFDGYISDITRTFAIGRVEPEMEQIARIVAEANAAGRAAAGRAAAGRAAAGPEVSAGAVDAAARQVIEQAGYGKYFVHRTGHGIGMEGHESPYIRAGSDQPLLPGMTFTIEPGIYLPERNGVRIEDNVVITSTGVECLTDLPRELIVLG